MTMRSRHHAYFWDEGGVCRAIVRVTKIRRGEKRRVSHIPNYTFSSRIFPVLGTHGTRGLSSSWRNLMQFFLATFVIKFSSPTHIPPGLEFLSKGNHCWSINHFNKTRLWTILTFPPNCSAQTWRTFSYSRIVLSSSKINLMQRFKLWSRTAR